VVTDELVLDRLGRSVRPLGPLGVAVAAPRDLVFDVTATATPWAMAQ
jgi:hypothetical protein